LQQRRAVRGDLGSAGPGAVACAGQQRGAERVLQLADLVADRAGAEMQRRRGVDEAAMPRDRGEGAQGSQGRDALDHRRAI
jgi:hypothetical protein